MVDNMKVSLVWLAQAHPNKRILEKFSFRYFFILIIGVGKFNNIPILSNSAVTNLSECFIGID